MQEKKITPVITLQKNGPIRVTGNFIIKGSDDKPYEVSGDAFLCRCGKSTRQPFCDGSHKESCD